VVSPTQLTVRSDWTLGKNEETRFDAFEIMKGLRKIVHVSWTVKKTSEGFLTKLE